MSLLFTEHAIGTLMLPNRLIRSATAESMADDRGVPKRQLAELYKALAEGGVGLIITGHLYVHPLGKAHPGMTGIYEDQLVPELRRLTDAVHDEGGKIAAQINHAGAQSRGGSESIRTLLAPSDMPGTQPTHSARAMTSEEISGVIDCFAQAAGRARDAGFDAVQIHAAHGYLGSQFLSPRTNRRHDDWGGDIGGRMRFLLETAQAVRSEVGQSFPVFTKLGMFDDAAGGLTIDEGLQVISELADAGLDAVEVSGGIASTRNLNMVAGIRPGEDEAYFRPVARQARQRTDLPILLVGGLRSRAMMEDVLASDDAQFISLSRPLICEPDLPNRLLEGRQDVARCISGNRCWPESPGDAIACKCFGDLA